jgi:hypothetical protein
MTDSSSKERAETSALEDVGAAIKREGRQVAGEARAAAQKMACDQRDALADYVSALAEAANRGADDLDSKGYGRSASTVARTADEVEGFARRLQARAPGELWEDVEDFAREHPALIFGAGFALAFGVTRFLKSSVEDEAEVEEEAVSAAPAYAAATPAMSGSSD